MMRLRSDSSETDFRRNFRFLNFRRGQPGAGNSTSATDGHQPATTEEEPPTVIRTYEQIIEEQHLCEASQLLIEREEHLFAEIREEEALKDHEEEVNKLAADFKNLEDLVLQSLRQSLTPEEVSTNTLLSALRAINQQVDQDKQWKERDLISPPWRPLEWRTLHNSTLLSLVEGRIDNPSAYPINQVEQSTFQANINSMGRQLKEDLLLVVKVVKSCYPPELDICNFYARLYHQTFSARLRKIAEFVLDDKDCTFLLRWVNEFYPQILQKPELSGEIDVEALGRLLPEKSLNFLEEQYLSTQQDKLKTYIDRVLEEAKEKWSKGEEPTREDGYFVNPVAYDIIQLVNGTVTSAKIVLGDLHKAQSITTPLTDLMQRYKSFHNDVMKQNKPNSRPFIKANLGCIKQLTDVLMRSRDLFPEDVRENCLLVLPDMKQSAHTYLLKPVHEDLKPQYRKLGTSEWLNKDLFDKLLDRIDEELQHLQGSIESCHQKLIGQLHREVTAEYVKRLLKGQVKLKDRERQVKAYKAVKNNAESLHNLFTKMGSREDWLREILIQIGEVLQLQELPAIQMQVILLATNFPDLSEKHVSALLKLKTNITKADRKAVKDTLSDALKETGGAYCERPFFSTVQVR